MVEKCLFDNLLESPVRNHRNHDPIFNSYKNNYNFDPFISNHNSFPADDFIKFKTMDELANLQFFNICDSSSGAMELARAY